jgi:alpha-ketoglutarate-dependent taurine dioxygenase
MRRLERVAAHVAASPVAAPADDLAAHVDCLEHCGIPGMPPHRAMEAERAVELARLFGPQARAEGPLMASGGGLRLTGVDLRPALSPEQAAFLVDALAKHRLLCIAGQDVAGGTFGLKRFERFASHYGAVVPHPNNFRAGGGDYADADTGSVDLLPLAERRGVSARIPGLLEPLPHDSPAVLTVANFGAASAGRAEQELHRLPASQRGHEAGPTPPQLGAGGGFHTDVEYEPVPIGVSMFLVHAAPTARHAPGGTWVADTGEGDTAKPGARFFRQGRGGTAPGEEGQRRRHAL